MSKPTALSPYQQRVLDQTKDWVNGNVRHNEIDGECCPDFSCCEPHLFTQNRLDRLTMYNKELAKRGLPSHYDA